MEIESNWYDQSQVNPNAKNAGKGFNDEGRDPWKHRSAGMQCRTCMFYVRKLNASEVIGSAEIGRCRRNAPTMDGYPVVFPTDWCGSHKLDEEKLLCG